jgi:hypothetical protein
VTDNDFKMINDENREPVNTAELDQAISDKTGNVAGNFSTTGRGPRDGLFSTSNSVSASTPYSQTAPHDSRYQMDTAENSGEAVYLRAYQGQGKSSVPTMMRSQTDNSAFDDVKQTLEHPLPDREQRTSLAVRAGDSLRDNYEHSVNGVGWAGEQLREDRGLNNHTHHVSAGHGNFQETVKFGGAQEPVYSKYQDPVGNVMVPDVHPDPRTANKS